MATNPMSVRLDKKLVSLLSDGKRRTPLNKQELVRRTLRLHLQEVIDAVANAPSPRVTKISAWPRGALAKAYRRAGKEWDRTEAAAVSAQGKPLWND